MPIRKRTHHAMWKRGYTLVELITVLAIVLVLSSLVLAGHNNFQGNILLSNLAYDVALSIRQAQTYGLGVREATIAGSSFDTAYGIHFEDGEQSSYVLFADLDRDFVYDGGSETVEVFSIPRGYGIEKFCSTPSSSAEKCNGSAINYLDIMFNRPEPEALIRSNIGSDQYESARIVIRSSKGTGRGVIVVTTGQITVVEEPVSEGFSSSSGTGFSSGSSSSSSSSGGGTWQGPVSEGCTQGSPSPQIVPSASCSPLGAVGYESFNRSPLCTGPGQKNTFEYQCTN